MSDRAVSDRAVSDTPSGNQAIQPQDSPFGRLLPATDKVVLGAPETGSCVQFSTTAGWADVPADMSHLTSDAATFEAWINTSASPDAFNGQVLYIGKNDPGASPRISVDASSRIKVYWSAAGSGGSYASSDTKPVTDGRWHHVAVVVDRGAITFYKDGQPTAEQSPVTMPGGQPASSDCQIGAGFGDATGFTGLLFDVRMWSQPRTAEQIRGLMFGAVDGTLTQQLDNLKRQGLLMAAGSDAGRGAPVNQVNGAALGLHGCDITQSPLPQNRPTFTLVASPADVHGVWNNMTPETIASMRAARSNSGEWRKLIQSQMRVQGLFSYLQQAGEHAFGDGTFEETGMPFKMAQWQDENKVTHTLMLTAGFTQPKSSGLESVPLPVGGDTASILYTSENQAVTQTQRVQSVTNWMGGATGAAGLATLGLTFALNRKLTVLKAEAGTAEDLWQRELLSEAGYEEAFEAVAEVEGAVKAISVLGRFAAVVAVLAALVDGLFRLFHPSTLSLSMWNETDLDLEWSLSYLNEGLGEDKCYWINSDKQDNKNWRPFPKKNTVIDDITPYGRVTHDQVAAVNVVIANGKPNIPLADLDICVCISIREKGSTADPLVLLLWVPMIGDNHMMVGRGKGDEDYFMAKAGDAPMQEQISYPFDIGGTQVEFDLSMDALKGQTNYGGIQGYNYNTLLYIAPKA